MSDVAEALGKVTEHYTEVKDQLKNMADDMINGKAANDETKASIDKVLAESNALQVQVNDLEQKMDRAALGGGSHQHSLGEIALENDSVKAMMESKDGKASFRINAAITSLTTDADGSAGDLIVPQRLQQIIGLADRRMTIRDLLLPGTTNSNSIEYVQETGFTNNAQIQAAQGDTKGKSSIKFDLVQVPVATIAHTVDASKQVLYDAPMLGSYLDYRLGYGLKFKEEEQLLKGSGVGANITGLITAATAYADPTGGDVGSPTMIDTLRLAMLQAVLAEYPATGHVLNPIDWTIMELTKDSQNRYIFTDPTKAGAPTLWGLPVIPTQAQAKDKFLTGAFAPAAQVFDREEVNVKISLENNDNFETNMVSMRCEERLALAIYRPEALIYGDFGNDA